MGTLLAIGLFPLALAAVATLIGWWIFYSVTKAAIRDGISEARIKIQSTGSSPGAPQSPGKAPSGFRWVLVPDEAMPHAAAPSQRMPDMRAD